MAYPDPPVTPPVPQRGDRTTFSNRVDAFLTWVAAIIPWLQGFVADTKASLSSLAAGGANSFIYTFDASTADSDPGPGKLRLGSASQSASTVLRIDDLAGGNVSIVQFLASITSGTSSVKGAVRIQKVNDPSAWALFDITAVSGTGYKNLTVIPRASTGASPFVAGDMLSLFFDRNGDSAAAGVLELIGGATISSAVANIDYLNVFTDAYEKYFIEVVGVTPSIAAGDLRLVLSNESGAIITSGYSNLANGAYALINSGGNAAQRPNDRCNLTIELKSVRATSEYKGIDIRGFFTGNSPIQAYGVSMNGSLENTSTKVNGFRLYWGNGANFARGYVKIYGLKAA